MICKFFKQKLRPGLINSLLIVACSGGFAHAQSLPSNYVLQELELSGQNSSMVKWTNLSFENKSDLNPRQAQESNPASTTTGTLSVISPGYMATNGLYSFTGDFGVVTQASNNSAPIRNVVIQSASMYNALAGSLQNQLNYDHTLFFKEGDKGNPGTGNPFDPGADHSYGYSDELAALALLVDDYQGGPILSWQNDLGQTGHLAATVSAIIAAVPDLEIPGAHATGTYYSFAWQWDLSSIAGNVISIAATIPIVRHASTLGIQVDLSDTYMQVVPEPALIGLLSSLILVVYYQYSRKRRNP